MTPLDVAAGTCIIKQGDTDAKTFYVLTTGCCEVLLQEPEWGTQPRQVLTYESGRYIPPPPLSPVPLSRPSPPAPPPLLGTAGLYVLSEALQSKLFKAHSGIASSTTYCIALHCGTFCTDQYTKETSQ